MLAAQTVQGEGSLALVFCWMSRGAFAEAIVWIGGRFDTEPWRFPKCRAPNTRATRSARSGVENPTCAVLAGDTGSFSASSILGLWRGPCVCNSVDSSYCVARRLTKECFSGVQAGGRYFSSCLPACCLFLCFLVSFGSLSPPPSRSPSPPLSLSPSLSLPLSL